MIGMTVVNLWLMLRAVPGADISQGYNDPPDLEICDSSCQGDGGIFSPAAMVVGTGSWSGC